MAVTRAPCVGPRVLVHVELCGGSSWGVGSGTVSGVTARRYVKLHAVEVTSVTRSIYAFRLEVAPRSVARRCAETLLVLAAAPFAFEESFETEIARANVKVGASATPLVLLTEQYRSTGTETRN